MVELSDRCLGVGDVGGDVAGQGRGPAREWVRQVGVIVASLAVAAGEPSKRGSHRRRRSSAILRLLIS